MADSRFNSGQIRAFAGSEGGTGVPSTLCQAGMVPLRVIVRNANIVPAVLALSFDAAVLSNATTQFRAGVFRLPADFSEVFVLQPGQVLYAISTAGIPIEASWAVSDALPIDLHA